jgi:predicted dienelactone hydrolase
MRTQLILMVLASLGTGLCAQSVAHVAVGGRDVAMWGPSGKAVPGGYPVIVFSHGFGGCNTQSIFLMEALSDAGYLVLAPNHRDASCGSARKFDVRGDWRPEEPFQRPAQWDDATYRDRAEDIRSVLDAVLAQSSFGGVPVDATRVGIAGHSLGGYIALGLAGAWPSWKDHRIRAVLALSPYCDPFLAKSDLGRMDVPVMYQGGTLDLGITPSVKRFNGAFDRSSPPKYFIEFKGAGHFAWTNLNKRYQDRISEFSVAFFDLYLKGPDRLMRLTEKPWPPQVSLVRRTVR